MSTVAPIVNGEVATNKTDTTAAVNKAKDASSLDKDDFLQLLVAEMKYQDPLEPTSNTDYVAQYAQFSQVETMQNMMNAQELQTATSLVGKYVTMNVTSSAGVLSQIAGRVDYVNSTGGKTYLYINGQPYNYDNLDTVWDEDFLEARDNADMFNAAVNSLPKVEDITLDYYDSVAKLLNAYNSMSEYQRSYITEANVNKLTEISNKLTELKKAADEAEAAKEEAEKTEETEKTTTV